jgi:hypothetical protein
MKLTAISPSPRSRRRPMARIVVRSRASVRVGRSVRQGPSRTLAQARSPDVIYTEAVRLFVAVVVRIAINCALGAVGVWLIVRGGGLTRDGLGGLAILLAAWEFVKLSAVVLGIVRARSVGGHS